MSNSAGAEHVAVLHTALNPYTGVWSLMRELTRAQAASGCYCAVGLGIIADKDWPVSAEVELKALGLPVFRAPVPRMFGTAQFLWQHFTRGRMAKWVAEFAAHSGAETVVVHFHNAWMAGVFLPIVVRGPYTVVPVTTFHGMGMPQTLGAQPVRRWLHRRLAQRLLRFGARLTSVEGADLAVAQELFGLSPHEFTVIPNGLLPVNETGCPLLRGAAVFTVGYAGALTESKGWEVAALAVQHLARAGTKIRLLIAGSGPDEDKARACAAAHPDCVEFLGHVAQPQQNLMPKLDVLALMSRQEGLPMVIIEAMAAGVPALSTAVGGVAEMVQDGENGYLLERTVEALEQKLAELCAQPSKLGALSVRAKQIFHERFEISRIAARYREVYLRPRVPQQRICQEWA